MKEKWCVVMLASFALNDQMAWKLERGLVGLSESQYLDQNLDNFWAQVPAVFGTNIKVLQKDIQENGPVVYIYIYIHI